MEQQSTHRAVGRAREAYGWPADLTDEQILQRLVALNHERAEEERRGIVRWLRPEFQDPTGASTRARQGELAIAAAAKPAAAKAAKLAWPKSLPEPAQAVRAALGGRPNPASAEQLAKSYRGAKVERVRAPRDPRRARTDPARRRDPLRRVTRGELGRGRPSRLGRRASALQWASIQRSSNDFCARLRAIVQTRTYVWVSAKRWHCAGRRCAGRARVALLTLLT